MSVVLLCCCLLSVVAREHKVYLDCSSGAGLRRNHFQQQRRDFTTRHVQQWLAFKLLLYHRGDCTTDHNAGHDKIEGKYAAVQNFTYCTLESRLGVGVSSVLLFWYHRRLSQRMTPP